MRIYTAICSIFTATALSLTVAAAQAQAPTGEVDMLAFANPPDMQTGSAPDMQTGNAPDMQASMSDTESGSEMQAGMGEHHPPVEQAMGSASQSGRWWNNPATVEKLKLTDEQRKAMDGILQAHREKLIDLRATLQKAELELEPMIQDDQPNETKILAQIDKVAQARAELEKANARFLLALREKLTPDQRKLLQTERANHQQRGWERDGQGANKQGQQGQRGQGAMRGGRMGGMNPNQPAPAQQPAPQGTTPSAPSAPAAPQQQ
jgi:Spy/CpxP family protein refolding chaperone